MTRKQQAAGAPEWVVTYGDMMSLLLCFFVALVAMSSPSKEDEKFQDVMNSIREAFGYVGGMGTVPSLNAPRVSLIQQLETIVIPNKPKNRGDSDHTGLDGRHTRIAKVREGLEITVGGQVTFDRFSAQLKPVSERPYGYRQ